MKKSLIPVTFDEKDGVNVHMFTRVLFTPGQNMWGLDPEGVYEGIYVGWNHPLNSPVEIKIDHVLPGPQPVRLKPSIENVWRIWDARDDEVEALRSALEQMRLALKDAGKALQAFYLGRVTPERAKLERSIADLDWRLTPVQAAVLTRYRDFIKQKLDSDDMKALRTFAQSEDYRVAFGDMGFDEAWDRFNSA